MRFAIFSSLISRSSTARASLQGLMALSALVVLTGAKGQGCGGVEVPEPPPEPDCGPGFHWETVCSPCDIGEMCEAQCVPDDTCPPGWLEQTTCGGGVTTVTTSVGQGGSAGGVGMPVPHDPGCWTECVPPPMCPPGTVEQVVCGGGSATSSTTASVGSGGWGSASVGVGGGWDGAADAAPPPDMCWTECVPVPYCPPGTRAHTVCEGSSSVSSTSSVGVGGSGGAGGAGGTGGAGAWDGTGGAGAWDGTNGLAAPPYPTGGGCRTECLPVEPYCPPGTREQTVCDGDVMVGSSSSSGTGYGSGTAGTAGTGYGSGTGYGAGGAYPGGGCWTDCVPVEPYCPPGTREQTVCSGTVGSAGSTGTGYGTGGSGGAYPGGGCWTECVPVEPYCPPDTVLTTVCEDPMPGTSASSGGYGDGAFEAPMPGTSGSSGTGYGGSGGAYPGGGCWNECLPVEPYCPPGTTEQKVCSGVGGDTGAGGSGGHAVECWTECLEEPTCPPEAIKRTICEEPSGTGGFGPVCRTECVLMLP
ncbi:hypothetical protein [Sorangium sp. So ce1335]|uniref:hypothetical protein n=1 Tax=Sorangium sp. So ce1335 TaxID=3133335 RepID=UPI003F5EB5ED